MYAMAVGGSGGRELPNIDVCWVFAGARPNLRIPRPPHHSLPPRPSRQRRHLARAPGGVVGATADPARERRMRPIARSRHQSMAHRIEVDVIEVSREIALVPYEVLPVPALPDRPLALQPAALVSLRFAARGN